MISFAKVPGDISNIIENQRNRAFAKTGTVQPYLLVEGTSESSKHFYVVIQKVKYKPSCATSAFGLLFKSFHVLNARYPVQTEHLWVLIKKTVFRIVTKYDKVCNNCSVIQNFWK